MMKRADLRFANKQIQRADLRFAIIMKIADLRFAMIRHGGRA